MDGKEFLLAADCLIANGAREADWRSAISRAYYAAFHVVRSRTRTRVQYTGSAEHQAAADYLFRQSRPAWNTFEKLRQWRVDADYQLDGASRPPNRDAALYRVEEARSFIDAIESGRLRIT